jgi:hypothetical protein
VQNQLVRNPSSNPLLASLLEYPLPTIAELSPRPSPVLSIDAQLLANIPIDPFDVARTRKRRAVADEAAQVVLHVASVADTTMEVDTVDLQEVHDSESAMVAVAPILTPVPFASPAMYASSEHLSGSATTGSRFLRMGAFAVAVVLAIATGGSLAVVATPAQKSPAARRQMDNVIRTKLPPFRVAK